MTAVDMAIKIPILVYHRVHADDETTVPADEGRVDLSEFRRQMQYLADSGARVVTHREIADWLLDGAELPGRAVAIDFDDNRLNVFENAFPILREHSFCATVFTITDLADGKVVFGPQDYPAMQWHQLATLRDAGWCIAPHTQRHLWLAGPERAPQDDQEMWDEMAGSKQQVETSLGIESPYFAYPNGSCNDKVATMARKLFRTARLWDTGIDGPLSMNRRDTDPHQLIGMNVSKKLPFDRFCEMVDGAQ
jgi:peptidoglycan/xylan/chitin deacetylase (PgdA/CDA1 family)